MSYTSSRLLPAPSSFLMTGVGTSQVIPANNLTAVQFPTTEWDLSDETSSNALFTAKRAGLYRIAASVAWGSSETSNIGIYVNVVPTAVEQTATSQMVLTIETVLQLDIGDVVNIFITRTSNDTDGTIDADSNTTWFTGYLLEAM